MPEPQPRTLADFGKLTEAEQTVLDQLDTGEVTVLGDGQLPPETAGEDRILRARFVRWLALGGDADHPLHEKGLQVEGALIIGEGADRTTHAALDLEGCEVTCDLQLFQCRFRETPNLRGARVRQIGLESSALPGIDATELTTQGLFSCSGSEITGQAILFGARIGGTLACIGTRFLNKGAIALNADRIKTQGYCLLRDSRTEGGIDLRWGDIGNSLDLDRSIVSYGHGMAITAPGLRVRASVFLRNADIEGSFMLSAATVDGDLNLVGARFGQCYGGELAADGLVIKGTLTLRRGQKKDGGRVDTGIEGKIDLSGAEIQHLNDDPSCWCIEPGGLRLDRLRYRAFTGTGINAKDRLRWLALQNPVEYGEEFWPQPYEHCAKVLREMGHQQDAKQILIEKERRQRAARRARTEWPLSWWYGFWDCFLAWTVRYGQRPLTALWWLGGLWLFGTMMFWQVWQAEAFKPNNAFVLRAPEWVECSLKAEPYAFRKGTARASQLGCFLKKPQGKAFPEFNAGMYTLDVLFPLVQLEQQVHWVPDEDLWPGFFAKGLVYLEIVAGWLLSLLAVAGLSGIIKSD